MTDSPSPELVLKRREDMRIRTGHCWVFSNEVDTARTPLSDIAPGAAARVVDHRGQFLAHALVNPHALICARVLSTREEELVDVSLLVRRVRAALGLRERYVGGAHYRL